MIECRRITRENAEALNLPNEPIVEDGRVIPLYDGRNEVGYERLLDSSRGCR